MYLPALPAQPATPKSFKKGYVHHKEYERQKESHRRTSELSTELQVRLEASRAMLHGWQKDEHRLVDAIEEEHDLLGRTGMKLNEALGCYQQLMERVERNQALMSDLAKGHGIVPYPTKGNSSSSPDKSPTDAATHADPQEAKVTNGKPAKQAVDHDQRVLSVNSVSRSPAPVGVSGVNRRASLKAEEVSSIVESVLRKQDSIQHPMKQHLIRLESEISEAIKTLSRQQDRRDDVKQREGGDEQWPRPRANIEDPNQKQQASLAR